MPANGETVSIATPPSISMDMSRVLFKRAVEESIGILKELETCEMVLSF